MKLFQPRALLTLGVVLLSLMAIPGSAQAQSKANDSLGHSYYTVTITNLTQGQIISAPVVYSHRGRFELFTPGEAAIPELAGLAEDADSATLLAYLDAEPWVFDTAIADGNILPGDSMSVEIHAPWGFRKISALGMLVTTNDAFFFGSTAAPYNARTLYAQAWDAGSEANTQECDHIPGPPCGNPGVHVEDGAEGFVYIHTGIQARGSLDPAVHDWRNPVAKIKIKRSYN